MTRRKKPDTNVSDTKMVPDKYIFVSKYDFENEGSYVIKDSPVFTDEMQEDFKYADDIYVFKLDRVLVKTWKELK